MSKKKKIVLFLLIIISISYFAINYFTRNTIKIENEYKYIRIKYLIMKKSDKEYKIKDVFPDHFEDFEYFTEMYVGLKKENNYYTASLKGKANKKILKSITDYEFALNDVFANLLDDCEFDKETLQIKIPAKYYSKKNKEHEDNTEIEILSRLSEDELKQLPISTKYKHYSIKNSKIERKGQSSKFNVEIAKRLKTEKLIVYLNNSIKLEKSFYNYNSKTGNLSINVSPVLVDNVYVEVDNPINTLFRIQNVEAGANIIDNPAGQIVQFQIQTPSEDPPEGASGYSKFYTSLWSERTQDIWTGYDIYLNPTVSTGVNIGSYQNPRVLSPSEFNINNDRNVIVGVDLRGTDYSGYSFPFVAAPGNPTVAYVPGNCAHVTNQYGSNGGASSGNYWYWWKIIDAGESGGNYYFTTMFIMDANSYYWTGTTADTAVQTVATELRFYYPKKYCATINKKDAISGANLSGVNFSIYSDSSCSNQVGTGTTNDSGNITWDNLTSGGSYWVKETSAKSGYENNNSGCISVSASVSSCPTTTFYDYPRYYCLKVRKADSENSSMLLNGAKFNAKNSQGVALFSGTTGSTVSHNNTGTSATSGTSAEGGYYIVDMLPYEAFTFEETNADGDILTQVGTTNNYRYWKSTTTTAAVNPVEMSRSGDTYTCPTGNTGTVPATNYKQYACIKVKKTDVHNNSLTGSSFKTTINGREQTHADNWDGVNDGYVTFFTGTNDTSSLRTYTVTEVSAPDEFRKAQNSVNVTEVLLPKNKTASEAEAICKDVDGVTSSGTKIIDSSGTVTASNKKYLINWYKEREDGTNTNSAEFKVYTTVNGTRKYVKAKSGYQTWKDESNKTKKCYVFDTLESSASSGTTFTSMNTQTNGGTSNGEVCIVGFDTDDSAGTSNDKVYTVEETKTLDFHTFGNAKTKDIKLSLNYYSEDDSKKFKNFKTEFRFEKTASNSTGSDYANLTTSELRKIPFSVYKVTNGTVSNTPIEFIDNGNSTYDYKANNIDAPSGTTVTQLFLSSSRAFEIYHLPKGNYILKELRKCCDNTCSSCSSSDNQCIGYYHPNNAGIAFTINDCSSPNATSCGSGNYGKVLKNLNNEATNIKFTKKDLYNYADATSSVKFVDEEERRAFDDITFNLKDASNNNVSLVFVKNHGNCKTDDSYAEYRFIQSNETLPSGTSRVTDLHTCGGHIEVTHLCRGKTYTMVEKSVPENTVFQGTSAKAVFNIPFSKDGKNCCDNTSRQTNTTAIIEDEPTEIRIYKKNYNPNENIKEGNDRKQVANFEVYRCNKSVETCSRSNATYGPIKFKPIANLGNTGRKTYKALLNQTESGITTLELDNTNGDDARIILTYLPANYKYVVVETNAPDGYYNVESTLADVEVEASPVEHDFKTYNKINYPTRLKFTKKDFYQYYSAEDVDKLGSSKKMFDSMTFQLHDKDGAVVNLYKVSEGHYRFINKKGEHAGTETNLHTYNGEMIITHVYRNENYYLEETVSDTEGDFILPNNIDNSGLDLPSSMSGNKHPIKKFPVGNLVPNSSDPDEVPESLTQEIYNDGTRVVFEKRDRDTGELIDDNLNTVSVEDESHNDTITTFNVYRCPKTENNCTVDNGELVYFEDRTYIKDKNGDDITNDITNVTPPVLAYKYSKENKSTGKVKDLHTDRGMLVITYLPSKNYKYILYETVAPNGYYQPRKAEAQTPFTVKESSLTTGETYETLTQVVTNDPTKIFFNKDDIYKYYVKNDLASEHDDTKKIFDSMTFVLRNSQGKIMKFKCSSNEEATGERDQDRCETGEYRYIPIDDDNTISELHTLNADMKITHLYRNETYYLEEVGVDPEGNFILPDYFTYDSPLPFDHKGHPVVKYIVPENGPTSMESVTELIENIPSRVIFQKRDSKYNYLIPDEMTTFNVYQCSEDVDICKPENGRIINFEERAVIQGDNEDTNKEVYKYSKLNKGEAGTTVDLHPYLGELIFRYLPTNYKYVLVEQVSPEGYMLPEGENRYTYFTISKSKVEVDEINVPNKPVSLLVRKYADDGELLEGAEFKLYKAKNCNFHVDPDKVEREDIVRLKTIRDGVYEARPAADSEIFKTCTDTPDMPCNRVNSTLTFPDYSTEVYGNSMGDFEALVNSRNEKIDIVAGEALIQYLDYGKCYVIEETKAPKGYSLPEKDRDRFVLVKVTDREQVIDTYEELINSPTPFTFYKLNEFNEPLDGGKYKLQVLNDKKIYEDVAVTREDKDSGEVYYRVDPSSENYIMETKDGKATMTHLEEGQYRVLEVEAPEGYELPKKSMNVVTFFVDQNGKVYGEHIIANKPATEVKTILPTSKATFIINIDTGQKVIKYGVIIGVIIAVISGLIFFKKKKIDKKDE